jgi:hypothetical protein
MTFTQQFLEETVQIVKKIDTQAVDRLVALLAATRGAGGRLFILGVGGSAGSRLKASVMEMTLDPRRGRELLFISQEIQPTE